MFNLPETTALRVILLVSLAALVLFTPACGTLLYPERHGQDGGDLDPTVLILDGIGLLFWVVPGLLAFIVDFATGSIYEPTVLASRAPEGLRAASIQVHPVSQRPRLR